MTGHRVLEPESTEIWVRKAIDSFLDHYIGTELVGYSCLAVGSDQLFAELIVEKGGKLVAVLPFAEYESTLSGRGLHKFRKLLAQASSQVLAGNSDRDSAYSAANQHLVNCVDILLAVWDGKPARGQGGTEEAVTYARMRGRSVYHIDPICRSLRWL